MTRTWNRGLALWAALLAGLPSAQAAWTELTLPNLSGAFAPFAMAHLPDGRFVYAESGQFIVQNAFGAGAFTSFAGEPALDPSFLAIYSASNAVAGGGGFGTSDLHRFDPSSPATPGFSALGLTIQNYQGVYRDANGLYISGAYAGVTHGVRYVSLDASVSKVIITNISTYSAGFTIDGVGALFVGDNDDGTVRKFSALQLAGAISGAPLDMTDGALVCDFGDGGDVGSLAVDARGRVWAAGWQHNGLWIFDPSLGTVSTVTPGLDNANYTVLTFQAGGTDYVAYINQADPFQGGTAMRYGFSPAYSAVPFSDELAGVGAAGLFGRSWVSSVVSYEPGSTPFSGGYAHDDAGVTSSLNAAVTGCPADFSLNGVTRHVVSLGNGGRITVTFDQPISDGPGPDFAVFENGFTDATDPTGTSREGRTNSFSFAELAYVEVGSTTSAWARFPVTALNTDLLFNLNNLDENRFASQDVTGLDGLAGKHVIDQGTPFDLARLASHPAVTNGSVNLAFIRFIRLTDVVGDGSVTDDYGHVVMDPYFDATAVAVQPATAATTDGFDLRGVVALHAGEASVAQGAGGPQVSCEGAAHTAYRLETAASAWNPTWTPLGVVTGRGERIAWTNLPSTSCVFRVQRWPVP